jgi:D-beta-D-heptose 7-phosphate kinase/D-beta-D-heptose 1-phosphate adenosyltransferase
VDVEETGPVSADTSARLARTIRDVATGAGVIILSDYGKGVVTDEVIAACRASGLPVIVDSKARSFSRYGAVDIIKPNASELAHASGLPTGTDAEVEAALARALELCEARAILVTRAAQGMSLAVRGQPVRHFAGSPREVFDVSGAGDTAISALGVGMATGGPLEDAIAFALLASGVAVGKVGTATVSPGELVEAARTAHMATAEAKIATPDRMVEEVARWRARGLRVGFTNGCFDILHRGHVAYLAQARSWCDRLIVGVNSDRSVRALKGEGRPVNDLESRALVLAGLASVDLVAPFDEETPLELIRAARPDVLVKGADYSEAQVVGGDLVRGWGGEVRLAALVDGYSTTAAILRMVGEDKA